MIPFSIILLLCLIVFASVNILFLKIFSEKEKGIKPKVISYIHISIIVAAKNEEQNIERLLKSFTRLDYPAENFEVIVVDDQSTDNTNSIVKEFITNIPNFKLINSEGKPYPAKKGALSVGISQSKFKYILTTDADCVVPVSWLKIAASQFSKESDIIFGLTPYFGNKNIVNRISSFERFRGQLLTFMFGKLRIPYSAGGGNFGFKKSSFEKLNGYVNTLKTLSGDDDLLINEAAKHNLKITPILDSNYFVMTDSPQTWKGYFNQRARHTSTSIYYRSIIKIALALWHLSNIVLFLSPILIVINWIFIIPFIIKLVLDFFIVRFFAKKFNYSFNNFLISLLQGFYEMLLIIHFLNSFKKKRSW